MKYRIKTITYKDGSVKYTVEYKSWLFWYYLKEWYMHYEEGFKVLKFNNREEALKALDEHFNTSKSVTPKSIQIEYINK